MRRWVGARARGQLCKQFPERCLSWAWAGVPMGPAPGAVAWASLRILICQMGCWSQLLHGAVESPHFAEHLANGQSRGDCPLPLRLNRLPWSLPGHLSFLGGNVVEAARPADFSSAAVVLSQDCSVYEDIPLRRTFLLIARFWIQSWVRKQHATPWDGVPG